MKNTNSNNDFDDLDSRSKIQDPENYIWGIFYFNKRDSRIILPKRNPYLGFTLNMANPLTYLIFLGILAAIFLSNYLS